MPMQPDETIQPTEQPEACCTHDCHTCGGCQPTEPSAAGHLLEQMLTSDTVYDGRILRLTKDTVRLENGKSAVREVIHHPGGACVVPLTEDGQVLLVRQYRYPHGTEMLELPAGKFESGEEPLTCATRELREETGTTANSFYPLGQLFPTPAYDKEVIHMYLAQDLHTEAQQLDADEFLDVVKMPLTQAVHMVMNDEIRDAKTQIALLKTTFLIMGMGE